MAGFLSVCSLPFTVEQMYPSKSLELGLSQGPCPTHSHRHTQVEGSQNRPKDQQQIIQSLHWLIMVKARDLGVTKLSLEGTVGQKELV